jgi:hypothetical protein
MLYIGSYEYYYQHDFQRKSCWPVYIMINDYG